MAAGQRDLASVGLAVALAVLAGAADPALGLDPRKAASQYGHRSWQVGDGLPQGSVQAITQTPDGFLWIGTHAGLARFDGVRFTSYGPDQFPELTSSYIWDLAVDTDGAVWIATDGGLAHSADPSYRSWTAVGDLQGDRVISLAPRDAGGVWAGTYDGRLLAVVPGAPPLTIPGLGPHPVLTLEVDRRGRLWAGTYGGGVYEILGSDVKQRTTADGLTDDTVWAVLEDRMGQTWISTMTGLHQLRGDVVRLVEPRGSPGQHTALALHEDRDGNLWLGTSGGGLERYLPGFSDRLRLGAMRMGTVSVIFEDRDGSLWIGASGDGLHQVRDGPIVPFGGPEGLGGDHVTSVWQAPNGDFWAATYNAGLNQIQVDGAVRHWTTADGLASDQLWSVLGDQRGDLWVGHVGAGIDRLRGTEVTHFGAEDGLGDLSVLVLAQGSDGTLWAGTNGGLYRLLGERFELWSTRIGLLGQRVRAFHEGADGTLWIGTSSGLTRWRDGVARHYTAADGLGSRFVAALHEDAEGSLWIGTAGGGLARLRDERIVSLTSRQGLPSDDISAIFEGLDGDLWLGSRTGILHLDRAELEAYAIGQRETISAFSYGTPDGMRSDECHLGTHPAGWRAQDGHLWFPTFHGISVLDPRALDAEPRPPGAFIERIEAGGESRAVLMEQPREILLATGTRRVEIFYTALDLRSPERLRFRYLLEGIDPEWVEVGAGRSAVYTNLEPGDYRFRVAARSERGAWGPEVDLALVIAPYLHERPFVRGLGLASLILGVTFYLRRLQKRLNNENVVNLRLRDQATKLELRDAEMTRFIYALSHDVKNPLVTVQSYLGVLERDSLAGDHEAVAHDLRRIRGATSTLQELMDDLLQLARVGRESVAVERLELGEVVREAWARVASRHGEQAAQIEFEIAESLPEVSGQRRRVREVFEVLFDNAVRFAADEMPWIQVEAIDEVAQAVIQVRDNGIGIEPRYHRRIFDLFERLDPSVPGTGVGLALAERIVSLHRGKIWVESEGEGHGSVFCVRLPKHWSG